MAEAYNRNMGIHERIREAREQAGLSQTELASLVGVTRSACSQWESPNGTAPKRERLRQLASLLDVNFVWLVTGEGHGNGVAPASYSLAPDQQELLDMYRQLPPRRRVTLLNFLRELL